jgi:hypothetical protein
MPAVPAMDFQEGNLVQPRLYPPEETPRRMGRNFLAGFEI